MAVQEKEFLARIEKHKGVIFKISRMYMDCAEDQKDLFQEIIYQIWKSYGTFQGKSEFSTWMYRIALNTAIIFLKSEKKRSFISNDEVSQYSVKEESYQAEDELYLKQMYEAIQKMSVIDKALIFYYLEGFSGKEIALQMGISEVNARVKLNRAKEKLRKLVSEG